MISVRLNGRLGNMMFQIACGTALAIRNDDKFVVDYSPDNYARKYSDNIFKPFEFINYSKKYNIKTYKESDFRYRYIDYICKTDELLILDGYFQSEKYFYHEREQIKNIFLFLPEIKENVNKLFEFSTKNYTGIHVRRGDYVTLSDIHLVCNENYYKRCMEMLDSVTDCFVFVSDDVKWCEEVIINRIIEPIMRKKCIIMYDSDELSDMYMLSQCNNVIMSNSSFSWWGTWLGKEKERVLTPIRWFNNGYYGDFSDIYCKNWERIDV